MLLAALLPLLAQAADTTPLFLERQKQLQQTSFFCAIGRDPAATSDLALAVRPFAGCTFGGPLDTRRDPPRLEPPFLSPRFGLDALRALLRLEGGELGADGSFRAGAESLRAVVLADADLKDPLFHFRVHPSEWGSRFLSIQAQRAAGVDAFVALARRHPEAGAFWANPHYGDELAVLPVLRREGRRHSPLPLYPRCGEGDPLPRLLIAGDLHRGADAAWFAALVRRSRFAFAALEISQDKQPLLDAFLAAAPGLAEEAPLAAITENYPGDVIAPYHEALRALKSARTPIVLIDYARSYFNFPFTDLAFHGLPIAVRNRMWASRLPPAWEGTGVLFAGRDHFLDLPGADFQDFALERFPGLGMAFVNPSETCAR